MRFHVNYIADHLCTHLQGALKKPTKFGAAARNASDAQSFLQIRQQVTDSVAYLVVNYFIKRHQNCASK